MVVYWAWRPVLSKMTCNIVIRYSTSQKRVYIYICKQYVHIQKKGTSSKCACCKGSDNCILSKSDFHATPCSIKSNGSHGDELKMWHIVHWIHYKCVALASIYSSTLFALISTGRLPIFELRGSIGSIQPILWYWGKLYKVQVNYNGARYKVRISLKCGPSHQIFLKGKQFLNHCWPKNVSIFL